MPDINIILVDDERSVVENLKDFIKPAIPDLENKYNTSINVEICTSAEECLEVVTELNEEGSDIAGVFSDVRMPVTAGIKDGVELLKKIAETNPKAQNGIITAWNDYEKAPGEIDNEIEEATHSFKYLKKPVTQEPLVKAVEASIDRFLSGSSPIIRAGGIVFKEIETERELELAFRLTYDVYVEELKKFSDSNVSEVQKQKRQKWDEYDFRADTRQIIAIKDGIAIGRVRIIYGDIPLEEDFEIPESFKISKKIVNEFETNGRLPSYLTKEKALKILDRKNEVSKLMMRKEFRSKGLYLGLLRFVYHFIKDDGDTYISAFKRLDKFYGKMGFRKMGEFSIPELNSERCSALHFFVPDVVNNPDSFADTGLNPLFTECIKVPIPNNKMEDLRYQAQILAMGGKDKFGSWFRKNKDRGNKVLQNLGLIGEY